MSKKNEKKNEDKKAEDETEMALQQIAANNQQLQGTAQNLAMALCSHYEQTINVLTGRVQELKGQIANMSQQGQE